MSFKDTADVSILYRISLQSRGVTADGVKVENGSFQAAMITDCSFGMPMTSSQFERSWIQVAMPGDMSDKGHMGNIFSAKFMPHTNNTKIISCAGDRLIKLSEVEYSAPERRSQSTTKRTWYCHTDMTKRIVTEDNPNTFLSCSEDGTHTLDLLRKATSDTMISAYTMLVLRVREVVPLHSFPIVPTKSN
jgi:hypothetical protein